MTGRKIPSCKSDSLNTVCFGSTNRGGCDICLICGFRPDDFNAVIGVSIENSEMISGRGIRVSGFAEPEFKAPADRYRGCRACNRRHNCLPNFKPCDTCHQIIVAVNVAVLIIRAPNNGIIAVTIAVDRNDCSAPGYPERDSLRADLINVSGSVEYTVSVTIRMKRVINHGQVFDIGRIVIYNNLLVYRDEAHTGNLQPPCTVRDVKHMRSRHIRSENQILCLLWLTQAG
nr:hypothetical protein [Thalassospira sp.]